MKIKILAAAALLIQGLALAQTQYGNIRGVVVDAEGAPLPGASVTLECADLPPRSTVSSEGGVFRFLNLTPGIYELRCELDGFTAHVREVIDIRVGTSFDFRIALSPAALAEEVTVVAASPIVDTKKTGTVTNVNQDMLQKLPSARDPWVILQQTPGILVDRENVGGSASGSQSGFTGRGGMTWNAQWSMDGVPTTDMAAYGSPHYYDFDTFEEMTIVTGGQDASLQTGGVAINLVTKRGGNRFQAQLRAFFTNDDLQSDNRTQELIDLGYVGDQISRITDYGVQLGGPIVKDKFWFWLGYGVQDIKRLTIAGYPDDSRITNFNAKLNFRLSDNNRAELAFMVPTKLAWGRNASVQFPPETTWDQKGASPRGFLKFEDEHTFSSKFLLSAKISYARLGFTLDPQGGRETQAGYDLATGIYSGSYYYQDYLRPSFVASLEGNYFTEGFLGGNHEIRFGVEYRDTPSRTITEMAGNALKQYVNGVPTYAFVTRQGNYRVGANRMSFFVNDAWTIKRLTLNLGFRLDREDSWNYDADVPASMVAPDLLPAVTYPGVDPGVTFLTPSPRFGFTYDLTGDGKTLLRGNLAWYGSQEGGWLARTMSTSAEAYAMFAWADSNGDDLVSTNELAGYPTAGILDFGGFDPWNPTSFASINGADPHLKTERSDEMLLGIEREIFTDFSLSANYIGRRNHGFMAQTPYDIESGTVIGHEDYVGPVVGTLTYGGTTYNYEYWALAAMKPAGTYTVNEPGYRQTFSAWEIAAVKRLSHRWMLNASFTYQVFKQSYEDLAYMDPTNTAIQSGQRLWGGPDADWMAKLSFLYQLPWGINFSGFANIRQGYNNVQRIRAATPARGSVGLGSFMDIIIEAPGTTRLPTFYNIDLSLTKDIRFKKAGTLTVCLDTFNTFNYAHTLQRYYRVNSTRHDQVEKILNPRVIRLGLKYSY